MLIGRLGAWTGGLFLAVACAGSEPDAGATEGGPGDAISVPVMEEPLPFPVPQIVTQVQHSGRELTVLANGIPAAFADTETTSHMLQISSFLVHGENVIRFEWRRLTEQAAPFSAVVQENLDPEGLTDLVVIESISDDPVGELSSREVTISVDMPRAWAWVSAPEVEVTATERVALMGAVRELHAAYADGDIDAVMDLTGTMFTEMVGFRTELLSGMRERYEELMSAPEWSVAPLPATMEIDSFGRLVRVMADGPIIESAELPGGSRVRLADLFFAKIGGRWTLVRSAL